MSDSEIDENVETVVVTEDSSHPLDNTLLTFICHGFNVDTPIHVKKIVLETFSLSEIKLSTESCRICVMVYWMSYTIIVM